MTSCCWQHTKQSSNCVMFDLISWYQTALDTKVLAQGCVGDCVCIKGPTHTWGTITDPSPNLLQLCQLVINYAVCMCKGWSDWSCLSVIVVVCLSSFLSVCLQKNTSSPDPGHPLVLNTFKLCKSLKTTLSVLLLARSTLQALKILRFGLAPWACLLTTLRYLAHIIWTTTH